MKFTKLFNVFKGCDESSSVNYVAFDSFVKYIKENDEVRTSNIKRSLGGLQTFNNIVSVPVPSILKYCFTHADSLKSCKYIAKVVENELLSTECDQTISSTLDLYKLIAKTKFLNNQHLYSDVIVDESHISTLLIDHKKYFSNAESWQKILWFENNFSKSVNYQLYEVGYEELVSLKFSSFQSLLSFKDCSEKLINNSKKHIKDKQKRIATADTYSDIEVIGKKRHNPSIIDNEVFALFQKYCDNKIKNVIIFDTAESVCKNSIQVVVSTSSRELPYDPKDLSERAFYFLKRKHGLNIDCIYFTQSDHLKQYEGEDYVLRFSLRDAIASHKVPEIFFIWKYDDVVDDSEDTEIKTTIKEYCEECYDQGIKPLQIDNFDILSEWFLETPAEIQILFENFINKKSSKKAKNPDEFVRHKISKLYRLHDILLNIFNRNYIGIYQQANSKELLVEYKSVSSVFDVTSSVGATTSLTAAETNLRKKSNDELCYFNTYLKQHKLKYTSFSGQTNEEVSLRQCHLILMFDNLVRLKTTRDHAGDDKKSDQLLTLPITLQGLPLDAEITDTWHEAECDGSETCLCKNSKVLQKSNINGTLLSLTCVEKTAHDDFFRLMTWGYSHLWKKLPGKFLSIIFFTILYW